VTEFCTYTTNADTDPVAMTRKEYDEKGLPDDWSDYIWQEAESKGFAASMHEQRHNEFMAAQSGMTVKGYIQNG
jgi:hypothetical protein